MLYLIVSLVIVAIALAVLMGVLTVGGEIGFISIVVIVVWVFLRKKR